jgi:ferrochelatase
MFQAAGGSDYDVIPCLNEHPRWIAALTELVLANLQGWLAPPTGRDEREARLLRARALGASA